MRSCTGWKRLSVNCSKRHDFPTPRSTWKKTKGSKQGTKLMILKATLRSMASILIYKMDPIFLAFTEKSRSKKATPTYVDILLTCISYNNVLKKICVRHFNDWISIFLPFSFNVVMSFLTYSWEIEPTHALWRHQWKPRCLFDPVPDSVQPIYFVKTLHH